MSSSMRVAAVTGWSGSGKTTLLTQLIARYVHEGRRVAAIKHTHHPLNEERRGDTARLQDAGAEPVIFARDGDAVVFHRDRIARVSWQTPPDLLQHVDGAEIVLVEGFKSFDAWPRIELDDDTRPTVDEAAAILDRIWRSHR